MKHNYTLESLQKTFSADQFLETTGLTITAVEEQSVTGSITVDSRHLRPGGIMNGGVSLLMVETVGSISSTLFIDLKTQNAFGIQVNANHISIAKPGDVLAAKSRMVHLGKTTHIWDIDIRNQHNKLVSSGRITMLVTNT